MPEKRKSYRAGAFQTREAGDGKYIEGYFAVYNQVTELWAGTFEMIVPGAFDASLEKNDIRCLYNHDDNIVLGRTGNGTLVLRSDEHGLFGTVRINENDSQALDAYARIERGDVDGCSFGFWSVEGGEEWKQQEDGSVLWRVLDTDTQEVSVCPFPQYTQTEITARKKDFENHKTRGRDAVTENIKERLGRLKC